MTREEAIKNIKEHCYFASLIPQAKEALDMAIQALEQEPKTGHWTHEYNGQTNHICSYCRFESGRKWNYCPNCGAKMESEVNYERII